MDNSMSSIAANEDSVSRSMWKQKTGLKAAIDQTMETFGVNKVQKGIEYRDMVAESGNQVLSKGVLNSIQLGKDTGAKKETGPANVGNNNVLQAWGQNYSNQPRKIVADMTKSPQEMRVQNNQSPFTQVDITA